MTFAEKKKEFMELARCMTVRVRIGLYVLLLCIKWHRWSFRVSDVASYRASGALPHHPLAFDYNT